VEKFYCSTYPSVKDKKRVRRGNLYISNSHIRFVSRLGMEKKASYEKISSIEKYNSIGGLVRSIKILIRKEDDIVELLHLTFPRQRGEAFDAIEKRLELWRAAGTHFDKELAVIDNKASDEKAADEQVLIPVPEDTILKKMDKIILDDTLQHVSVHDFYKLCWDNESVDPFYKNWLNARGSIDVQVGPWQYKNNDNNDDNNSALVNQWCGETYRQKRTVTFKFVRTSHTYMGPPVASVTHTQHCKVHNNDKCVLSMTVKTDGIPFADTFQVEVRWVATRIGCDSKIHNNDLRVQVGLYVHFLKSSMLSTKIRDGTITETTKTQTSLFQNVKKVCYSSNQKTEENNKTRRIHSNARSIPTHINHNIMTETVTPKEKQEKQNTLPQHPTIVSTPKKKNNATLLFATATIFILFLLWKWLQSDDDVNNDAFQTILQLNNNLKGPLYTTKLRKSICVSK